MNDVSPRDRTREQIYRLIRDSSGVTRASLVSATGLSSSTVGYAVSRLIDSGRVAETNVETKGPGTGSGRRATVLTATDSGRTFAGIDFGHSHVRVALALGSPSKTDEINVELDIDHSSAEAMDAAADILATLRQRHGVEEIGTIVAGIPGPIDRHTGLVRSPTILSGWVGLQPADELSRRLGQDVHIENDALLGALGEHLVGAGRGHDDMVYVKASHGMGAGMVLGGKLFRGAMGTSGEIGHTHLSDHTEQCRCGNRGCLEAVVSVPSVMERLRQVSPDITRINGEQPAGVEFARHRILEEAGFTLGRVLADVCNLLNPSCVVIGGELGCSGEAFVDGIRGVLNRYAQPAISQAVEVVPAELCERAEVTGALQLAHQLQLR